MQKVILISGISSGFGFETARALAAKGHIVYGTVRRDTTEIPGVHYLKEVDVRNEESVRIAVNQVLAEQGHIDVLLNNAGMGIGGPIELTPTEDIKLQMDTNFMGLTHFVRYVLPEMRKRRKGTIIAISSIGGLMGLPFQGFYSASKFAIEGFMQALRIETREFGIKCSVIEPGDFSTGFTANRLKELTEQASETYPHFKASMEGIERDEKSGMKPENLAARICSIVECNNPRCSYVVASPIQHLAVWLNRFLPERFFSLLLGKFYGL